MESTATIYCLKDPTTGAVRYIGNTNQPLSLRVNGHRWEARNSDKQTPKIEWLRTLDVEPIVEIIETVPQSAGAERERFWIKKFRDDGADLVNSWMAGRGHTEESKAKMRAAALRNGARPPSRTGQPVSEEARQNMRNAAIRRGTKPPPMGGWNKGRRATHCKNGHDLSENGYYDKNGRYHYCKACQRQ